MTTIADFLLARIAEDEAAARRAERGDEVYDAQGWWDGPRVLAECEAKRRIVDLHNLDETGIDRECGELERNWPCMTLLFLATPYADHPEYCDGWRVTS